MKPVHCALAVLACVSASVSAQSQSTVMHGVAEPGCSLPGCSVTAMGVPRPAVSVYSREPLGERFDAIMALEQPGLQFDSGYDGSGTLFRQAYVGLSGKFGTLTLGRHYALDYAALMDVGDPFQGGLDDDAGMRLAGFAGRRTDASVRFQKRNRHGLFTAASFGIGERRKHSRGNRHWGVSIGLDRGPLVIRAAYQKRNVTNSAVVMPLGSYDSRHGLVAANLTVGRAIAYAAYGVSRGYGNATLWNPANPFSAAITTSPSMDSRDLLFGLAVPDGSTTWLASFIRKNDRDFANNDAEQVAFGASYALSRRTDIYAAISHIAQRGRPAFSGSGESDAARDNKAINIGMRHAF